MLSEAGRMVTGEKDLEQEHRRTTESFRLEKIFNIIRYLSPDVAQLQQNSVLRSAPSSALEQICLVLLGMRWIAGAVAAQESPVLTNSTARAPPFCPHVAEMMQGRDNPSPTASLRKDETALGTGWTMQVTTRGSWPFARRAQGRAVSVWGTHTRPSRLPSTHWLPKSYARDRKLPWCESRPASLEPAAERARGSQLHHWVQRD